MNIAFMLGDFPGLSETFILSQIMGLLDRGHEVTTFASRPPHRSNLHPEVIRYGLLERTHYRGMPRGLLSQTLKAIPLTLLGLLSNPTVTVRSWNFGRYGLLAASGRLFYAARALGKGRRFDVIHCHFGPYGLLAVALREIGVLEGPITTVFHGYDMTKFVQRFGERVYERLFKHGDLFLPISEAWRQRLLGLGCPPERTTVHHMGIDCSQFAPGPEPMTQDGVFRVVTVARLIEKKGVEYGIRAIARLTRQRSGVEYNVLGDGPLRASLQDLTRTLGVADVVKFRGAQPQNKVREWLRQSAVLLAPSITSSDGDQEGIPVVLMEALATQIPVVSTLHSGIPELVQDGVSGFLVPERDSDALAERLRELVDQPGLRSALGRAGGRFVQQNFNIERLNDQLVAAFQRLVDSR